MKRQNNVEFVIDMMKFSRYGAMAQLFVLQALDQYSHAVANAPPESFAGSEHLINARTWQGVAKEIAQKMEQRLNQ
jgi:hypothetical protein